MINVEKLLNDNKNVSFYRINDVKTESFEVFFVKDKLETIRKTDTFDEKVTVYVKHDDFLGQAAFSVLKSDNAKSVEEKINMACNNAFKINNKPYELPKNEKLVKSAKTNIKEYDFKDLALEIYNIIKEEIDNSSSKINALEIFIYKTTETVKNSKGINKKETRYSLFIEAIPTFDKKDESFELYQALSFSSFDINQIKNEVKKSLEDVRKRALAIKPDFKIDCNVILNKHELSNLFSNIAYSLNYSILYRKSNLYNVGDNIQKKRKGDSISIKMTKGFKGSTASRFFDSDGVTLIDREIVKNGKVLVFFGGTKFAQYVGETPTGDLPCIEVKKGKLKEEDIKNSPYLNCVSFSGIQVDLYNDYIGGEIRLAYYFDGKNEIPVTGISISGSLSEVLSNIKLSEELDQIGNYKGPKYASLSGMKIH